MSKDRNTVLAGVLEYIGASEFDPAEPFEYAVDVRHDDGWQGRVFFGYEPDLPSWRELFPEGRCIFYEGADPHGFATEIRVKFGFDPSESERWNADEGWCFHCPPEHLDAIYGSDRWPMGS